MIWNADSKVFKVTTNEPDDIDDSKAEEQAQADAAKKKDQKIEIEVEKSKEPTEKKSSKPNTSEGKTKGK